MIATRRAFWGPAGCFFWTVRRYTWRMETVVKNVTDMAGSERCAAELLLGHPLRGTERLILQVVESGSPHGLEIPSGDRPGNRLPKWCQVFEGLSDEEIAALDREIIRDVGGRSIE
jgi:hypothetical protein